MRPAAAAAAAVAVAVICAGCLGGGSGSSGSASHQLTHAEYVAKAGAVCSSYRKRIAALPTPSDLQKLADSGERAIELQRQEVAELRRLALGHLVQVADRVQDPGRVAGRDVRPPAGLGSHSQERRV
ncbi:MAG TPA: hypothetical protein VM823_07370, partial [Gaiellales bacterium]|nr:hypothetical protein [Gaiellales bacterium]